MMKRHRKDSYKLSHQHGFTLVELMIAIAIGIVVIGVTYASYISQQRSFMVQDQVSEMNSASKIALDMIANDIREAGFGVPDNLSNIQRTAGCFGINGFTQKVNVVDNTTSADQITLLGAYRWAGDIANAVSAGATQITLTNNTKILNTTDRSYISIGGLGFAVVIAISKDTLTLNLPLDRSYPAGVPVYLVENITYQVVFDATDKRWELRRVSRLNGGGCETSPHTATIAENIEDLQFALVDVAPADGVADRIRVNILARTARPDLNFQGQGNPPSTIENRKHATTNDSFRRRWWQMEVDLRNPI